MMIPIYRVTHLVKDDLNLDFKLSNNEAKYLLGGSLEVSILN